MLVSVCLALYNGEQYIIEQLISIIPQMSDGDELIISDGCSTDASLKLVNEFVSNYNDIRIIVLESSKRRNVLENFEHAIGSANNALIVFCDQDDVWKPHKLERIREAFRDPNLQLYMHDAEIVDAKLAPLGFSVFERYKPSNRFFRTLYKNSFVGCCMAVRSCFLERLLPFPRFSGLHDHWLALNCLALGYRIHLDSSLLIQYRRHNENASPTTERSSRSLIIILFERIMLMLNLTLSIVKFKLSVNSNRK